MTVLIYVNGEENLAPEQKDAAGESFIKKAESIYASFLSQKQCIPPLTKDIEISLAFVDKTTIADMNLRYREVEGPTDVLSFPMWEGECGAFQPPEDWETLQLGDIIVCPDVVAANAADNGKTFAEEVSLVIFHGCLHLVGYDHDTDERRGEMWREQDAMMAALFAQDGDNK